MSTPITVVLADDHAPTRSLIRLTLEEQGLAVVGEGATGAEAVRLVVCHRPDLCLIDRAMPGGGGLEAIAEISHRLPATLCIMLSALKDDDDALAALAAGAVGYLSKDMDMERLGATLRGVLRGEPALSRRCMGLVVRQLRGR